MQLTSILIQEIIRYFAFIRKNKRVYLVFGRQLVISEIAGLVAGVLVAEGISGYFFFNKKIEVSLYSGIADYAASILSLVCIIMTTKGAIKNMMMKIIIVVIIDIILLEKSLKIRSPFGLQLLSRISHT